MREHELILDVVRERTDPDTGMPASIPRFDLVGRAAGAGVDKRAAGDYIQDLVETDHLVSWEIDASLWHYAGGVDSLPEPLWDYDDSETRTWLCLGEESRLQRAVIAEANRVDVNKEVVGQLNRALSALGGDGDD